MSLAQKEPLELGAWIGKLGMAGSRWSHALTASRSFAGGWSCRCSWWLTLGDGLWVFFLLLAVHEEKGLAQAQNPSCTQGRERPFYSEFCECTSWSTAAEVLGQLSPGGPAPLCQVRGKTFTVKVQPYVHIRYHEGWGSSSAPRTATSSPSRPTGWNTWRFITR